MHDFVSFSVCALPFILYFVIVDTIVQHTYVVMFVSFLLFGFAVYASVGQQL